MATPKRVLTIADVRGDVAALEAVLKRHEELGADAVVLVGDLSDPAQKAESFRGVLRALGAAHLPTFWVPGPHDAPVDTYLRESYNIEVVYPFLHGVHGTAAVTGGYVVFAGMGGRIVDQADVARQEHDELVYPGWEAEYRLKVIRDLAHDYQKVLLFSTAPAHKGLGEPGSAVVAELIKTYAPRLAVAAGGAGVRHETLGTSLVVLPGSLAEAREFAVVDLRDHSVAAHTA